MASNPNRIRARGTDGQTVSLSSLPLVAFALSCGHLGREYGVAKRDVVFCDSCGAQRTIARVIAG